MQQGNEGGGERPISTEDGGGVQHTDSTFVVGIDRYVIVALVDDVTNRIVYINSSMYNYYYMYECVGALRVFYMGLYIRYIVTRWAVILFYFFLSSLHRIDLLW